MFQKEMVSRPKSGRGSGKVVLEMSAPKSSPSKNSRNNDSDDEEQEGEEDEASIGNIMIKRCPHAEYFLDPYGQSPKVTEEVGARGFIYPAAPERKKRFIGAELSKLRQMVRQQNQQFLYSQLYTRTMAHSDSMTPQHLDQFEAEKRRISNLTDFELEKDPAHIDWEAIQAASFPNRTPNELETEWRLFCDPNYVRGPWSTEEDAKLLESAQAHKERHWDRIAADMGNKRLPVQYLSRYQQSLRPKNTTDARETTSRSYSVTTGVHKSKLTRGTAGFQLALEGSSKASKKTKKSQLQQQLMEDVLAPLPSGDAPATPSTPSSINATSPISAKRASAARRENEENEEETLAGEEGEEETGKDEVIVTAKSGIKWTPDEDELLTEAVKRYGDKNWTAVASLLGSLRTGQQCLHRWQKTLNPSIRRGRWEQEEDNLLAMAVKAYGAGNWRLIQKHVPGRTDVQCRERWVNILDPSVKSSEGWTAAEDAHLLEIVASQPQGKWSLVAKFHNEGMLAQYHRLISPPPPAPPSEASTPSTNDTTSSSMDVENAASNSTNSSQPTSTHSQTITVSSQELAENATPTRASGRKNGRRAPAVPVLTKPPTRTDNQCWRRWKILRKVTPKKSGGPAAHRAASMSVDIEAIASGVADSGADNTGEEVGLQSSSSHSTTTPQHTTPGRKTPQRARTPSSTPRRPPSTPTAGSSASSATSRASSATRQPKESAKKGSSSKKRGRKVPDWMRDDSDDYDDDDDEDAIVMPKAKKPKLSASALAHEGEGNETSQSPSAAKRSTRHAAKAAAAAMAAASQDIPPNFIDLPPFPPQHSTAPRSVPTTKRTVAISVVQVSEPLPPGSGGSNSGGDGATTEVQEEGSAQPVKRSLKLRITKTKPSS